AASALAQSPPPFPLRQVVHTGHASGIEDEFVEFGTPVINASGLVAFEGSFRPGPLLNEGLFTDTANGPGVPSLVARNGQPAPGTATNFGSHYLFPYLNDAGHVGFDTLLVGDADRRSALYAGPAGPVGSLSLLAREGDPTPDAPAGSLWWQHFEESPFPRYAQGTNDPGLRLNQAGQVAFGG